VTLDPDRIALAYASERYGALDGTPPIAFAPLSGFFRAADGWVRTHGNYPHHASALRGALGLPDDAGAESAAAALAGMPADISVQAITSRGGIAAAVEMARRLRISAPHVITGHNHRAGPREGEQPWEIPGGGLLHNTGNWIFTAVLHPPGAQPGPYWPGTVTWLEDSGPPRRTALLADRGVEDLAALARGGRVRLTGIASSELG
jgi:hypothetical protein